MAKMTEHTLRKFDTELQEIRRSVLQANPNSVCIIGEGGGRSGACE